MDNNAKAVQNANQTAWQRVLERVEKLKLGLERYKPAVNGDKAEGAFHETLIDNIKELVELMPSINIAGDQNLKRIGQKLLALTAYTAKELKESDALRADMAKASGQGVARYRAGIRARGLMEVTMKTVIVAALLGIVVVNPSFADNAEDDDVYRMVTSVLAYEKVCVNETTLDPALERKLGKALTLIQHFSEDKFIRLTYEWRDAIKKDGCARAESFLGPWIRVFKE